jgi:hypothetical protein
MEPGLIDQASDSWRNASCLKLLLVLGILSLVASLCLVYRPSCVGYLLTIEIQFSSPMCLNIWCARAICLRNSMPYCLLLSVQSKCLHLKQIVVDATSLHSLSPSPLPQVEQPTFPFGQSSSGPRRRVRHLTSHHSTPRRQRSQLVPNFTTAQCNQASPARNPPSVYYSYR